MRRNDASRFHTRQAARPAILFSLSSLRAAVHSETSHKNVTDPGGRAMTLSSDRGLSCCGVCSAGPVFFEGRRAGGAPSRTENYVDHLRWTTLRMGVEVPMGSRR